MTKKQKKMGKGRENTHTRIEREREINEATHEQKERYLKATDRKKEIKRQREERNKKE